MNKIKTIIIDDNNIVVNSLSQQFASSDRIEVVKTFDNGEDALNYMVAFPSDFDVIIMDILLPRLDGMALLEELKIRGIKKNAIILSSYKDENIINKCMNYNVSHYMLKPINFSSLERRVYEASEQSAQVSNSKQDHIDVEVSKILHNLGIPTHIRGYKYIRDGVLIIYNNEKLSFVTKEIYPQIASKYETTPSRVERAMRHAIEVGCVRGDLALMEELFGFSISSDKDKPTNSEFLSTIADRLRLDKGFKSE